MFCLYFFYIFEYFKAYMYFWCSCKVDRTLLVWRARVARAKRIKTNRSHLARVKFSYTDIFIFTALKNSMLSNQLRIEARFSVLNHRRSWLPSPAFSVLFRARYCCLAANSVSLRGENCKPFVGLYSLLMSEVVIKVNLGTLFWALSEINCKNRALTF